ncbi:MAG: DNA polymerase III subunit delta', partial [Deltaproteobacteria bacterium]|nr:DNA polymerase III subunit delta' [Deltaproteobacteria bacterium]
MASQKIPHAYLFAGIPGIGKTSTAMAFAMALNCREPNGFEGCGHCPACRQLIGGNFPDFLSIQPEGQNILIEQIKDLNRSLGFAPVSGGYRVSVIHQAETMTDEAANSFLKTLEEPPPKNILILKVTEPLDLFPTIVSRCQKVPFQPLSARDIKIWLIKNRDLNEETATLLARISEGSLGRALRMYEGDFLEKRTAWLSKLMQLPGFSKEEALNMALECAEEDRKKGLDFPASGEAGMLDMLSVWGNWYRDLLLLQVVGSIDLLINIDFSNQLKKNGESFTVENLIDSIMAVHQARLDIRRMRNATLVMEHMVLRLNGLAG